MAGAVQDDPDFHKPPGCGEARPADTLSPSRDGTYDLCVIFARVFNLPAAALGSGQWGGAEL